MFYPNPLNLAQRSVLPLVLLCALSGQSATAATAGMCHYLTNTVIQNVTGYDAELVAQTGYVGGFNVYPALPTTWTLATGGVTGFTQTWGLSNSTTGGQMLFQINDGKTNPQFQFTYWSGVGTSPSTIADALAMGAQSITEEALEDAGKDAAEDAEIAAVPPPGDAILATVKVLKDVWDIAAKIASAFSAEAYLNIDPPDGAFPNNDWPTANGVSVNTDQTNTVVVPSYYQGATGETAILNGYVVSASAINNGCTNSWNVVVTPYCAYVCGYASANNTAIADANCASTAYCSSTASASTNALFAKSLAAR